MKTTFHTLAKRKEAALGIYVGDTGACVGEIAALAGFDYMRIDTEHTLMDEQCLRELIRIADAHDIPTLVRVCDLDDITKVLDYGASGVLVPNIDTAEQAREAVRLAKFASLGERGMTNISRCVNYGLMPLTEYHAKANAEVCLAVQIESAEAMKNLDEILAVEGIDIVATGMQDMSQSLGYPGKTKEPIVAEQQEIVIKKSVEKGLYPLISAGTPEQAKELVEKGVILQTICFDNLFIAKQFQKLVQQFR